MKSIFRKLSNTYGDELKEPLKVIVIDDSDISAYMFRDFINMDFPGIKAHCETSPVPLDIYEDYDVVLLDYRMGRYNGSDIAKQVYEKYPQKKGILLTDYELSEIENPPPGWVKMQKCGFKEFTPQFENVLRKWGFYRK